MKLVARIADSTIAVFEPQNSISVSSVDAYFGSNFFVDIVHKVQLNSVRIAIDLDDNTGDTIFEIIKPDVSFASPLSANVTFTSGDTITFSDLLRIYRFENRLAIIKMTGQEIKDYLEFAYNLWIMQLQTPDDQLLRLNNNPNLPFLFISPAFNFDSGAGLDYEVNVTKPNGRRITIQRMWSDKPFHADSMYVVAVNSYRFNGAGGHLQLGAKISHEELQNRLVRLYDVQVRELVLGEFAKQKNIRLFQYDNWKFVPDIYAVPALQRDRKEVFERLNR
jgi:2',3'-cyclic-nucleotide 2'-phosphodiesterase/3'-nucleotidase